MAQDEKKGLGGWLILVGLGVVITPVKLLYNFIPVFVPIFTDGTWEALTNEESGSYHPLFKSLLLGELTFNLCLVIATIYLIYLFFTKHYRFPVIYIIAQTIPDRDRRWPLHRLLHEASNNLLPHIPEHAHGCVFKRSMLQPAWRS